MIFTKKHAPNFLLVDDENNGVIIVAAHDRNLNTLFINKHYEDKVFKYLKDNTDWTLGNIDDIVPLNDDSFFSRLAEQFL